MLVLGNKENKNKIFNVSKKHSVVITDGVAWSRRSLKKDHSEKRATHKNDPKLLPCSGI